MLPLPGHRQPRRVLAEYGDLLTVLESFDKILEFCVTRNK